MTQQNASASEEMSATSEELAAQAEQLQASIAFFRIDGAGHGAKQAGKATFPTLAPARAQSAKSERPTPTNRPDYKGRHGNGSALNLSNGRAEDLDVELERH